MAERAGYDQAGDEYTGKNASFVLGTTPDKPKMPVHPAFVNTEHADTTVIMNQPQSGTVFVSKPLPNHMITALCVTMCCFWPTGLFAVYFAYKTRNLENSGDYGTAKEMSDISRKLIIATVCLGLIIWIFSIIMYYASLMQYFENVQNG